MLLPVGSLATGASSIYGSGGSRPLLMINSLTVWYSEHGAPHDRTHAVDVIIRNAPEYSMDQYASKVVEKCLKVMGNEFLDSYLDRVCEGRPDRPRIPLIDSNSPLQASNIYGVGNVFCSLITKVVASDQYGNHLVYWILEHASIKH